MASGDTAPGRRSSCECCIEMERRRGGTGIAPAVGRRRRDAARWTRSRRGDGLAAGRIDESIRLGGAGEDAGAGEEEASPEGEETGLAEEEASPLRDPCSLLWAGLYQHSRRRSLVPRLGSPPLSSPCRIHPRQLTASWLSGDLRIYLLDVGARIVSRTGWAGSRCHMRPCSIYDVARPSRTGIPPAAPLVSDPRRGNSRRHPPRINRCPLRGGSVR